MRIAMMIGCIIGFMARHPPDKIMSAADILSVLLILLAMESIGPFVDWIFKKLCKWAAK